MRLSPFDYSRVSDAVELLRELAISVPEYIGSEEFENHRHFAPLVCHYELFTVEELEKWVLRRSQNGRETLERWPSSVDEFNNIEYGDYAEHDDTFTYWQDTAVIFSIGDLSDALGVYTVDKECCRIGEGDLYDDVTTLTAIRWSQYEQDFYNRCIDMFRARLFPESE